VLGHRLGRPPSPGSRVDLSADQLVAAPHPLLVLQADALDVHVPSAGELIEICGAADVNSSVFGRSTGENAIAAMTTLRRDRPRRATGSTAATSLMAGDLAPWPGRRQSPPPDQWCVAMR